MKNRTFHDLIVILGPTATGKTKLAVKIAKANSKIEKSEIVGKDIADKLISSKIKKIIFDRNGYRYHGRVKALADSIRELGITI